MRLWIVAVLLAGVAVRAQSPGEPASIDSQRRAAAVVEDAVRAMGGIERLSAISSLTLSEVGQHQWPHQSATARPPWRTGERTEETVLDRKGERLFIDARVSRPDYYFGWPGTIVIGTSGFTLDHHSRMVTPIPRTSLDNYRAHLFQRFPHEVLLDARARQLSLRHLGAATIDKRQHDVVSYVAFDGRQTALYVDSATRLLTQYEQIFTDPIVGDSVTGVRFEGYRDVQGIRVPGSREQFRGTSWTIRTNYRAVSFNAPVDPSRFEVPSGYQQISYQPPSTPSVTSVGDGVYFLSGLTPSGRFNVLFVEFADHVVVVNAPTPSAVGEEVIARVTAAVPGKPIRTLVLTHPAYDHIAGVRAFVARGITVVAGAETRRMVEDAVAARFTIEPDALARAPRPLSIEDAGRRRVFADGRQRLELIDIGPDETGRDVLIAYLPAARLVFQADLVNPNYAGALGVAQPAAIMLEQRLTALKLDVERIAGGHGGVVARADLQQAVRRARGVTSPGR